MFTTDGPWTAPNNYKGHAFTLKLSECKLNLAGVRIKNSCCARATRAFRILGILEKSGPWVQLLEGEFDEVKKPPAPPPTLQTFYFEEAVELQFLRFDLVSFWGQHGGGIGTFEVITVSGD